jgi:predicted RNA-binding protein YlxR (DUF448 family)
MRERHVPQRTCVICGTKSPKRELVRVVMTPDGECKVDATGKLAGRGAYLCHRPVCWDKVVKGGRLAHALRGAVSPADNERLAGFGAELASTT